MTDSIDPPNTWAGRLGALVAATRHCDGHADGAEPGTAVEAASEAGRYGPGKLGSPRGGPAPAVLDIRRRDGNVVAVRAAAHQSGPPEPGSFACQSPEGTSL